MGGRDLARHNGEAAVGSRIRRHEEGTVMDRHQHGGGPPDTRERIIGAARSIALERGYKGTTLAMIQQRARVHPGSFYWHFKDKDALFAAMVAQAREEVESTVAHLETGTNPVKAVLDRIVERPERFGLWRFNVQLMMDQQMHGSDTAAQILELRVHTQRQLTAAWLEHIPARVLEELPGLPDRLADYLLATVEGCVLSRVAGTIRDEESITAMSAAVMDRMVAAACQSVGEPVPELFLGSEGWADRLVASLGTRG